MNNMKKAYISPKTVVEEALTPSHMLASSYTEIGGTTDSFEAKQWDSFWELDSDIDDGTDGMTD